MRSRPLAPGPVAFALVGCVLLAVPCAGQPAPGLGPVPGTEPAQVTVDPQRLCVLVNGEPFFPVGTSIEKADALTEASAGGLNLAIHWGGPSGLGGGYREAAAQGGAEASAFLRQYLEAGQKAGLWVVEWPLLYARPDPGLVSYGSPSFAPAIAEFVQDPLPAVLDAMRDHPALLGYYGPDEPNGEVQREPCAALASAIHARDSRHPVYLLFGTRVEGWPEACDITGADWYPMPGQTPLYNAYRGAKAAAEAAHAMGRPYWHMPLMEIRNGGEPPLSPDEQRAQTYLSLVAGANGIIWWTQLPRQADNWAMVTRLAGEMRALTPILTEPPAPTNVLWSPPSLSSTVQVRAVRHAGRTFLIAANACESRATVRFTLPSPAGKADVWFEGRAVEVVGDQFTDSFEGYGRRVYDLGCQWSQEAEITLEVHLSAVADPMPGPHRGDPLEANLLRDPGFESNVYWAFDPMRDAEPEAEGRLDETAPHRGLRCAHIGRNGAQSRSAWTGAAVELKPNTRYVFGGWMRSETTGETKVGVRLAGPVGMDYLWGATEMLTTNHGPWRQYSTVFTTRDQPERVRPVCFFTDWYDTADRPGSDGNAWFDDLFLVEAAGVRNMVPNGGFEGLEVLPGWPRWWAEIGGLFDPGHIGRADPLWGVDSAVAYEGRNSLRIVNPGRPDTVYPQGLPAAYNFLARGSRLLKGHTYTMSAYLRADRPSAPVWFYPGGYTTLADLRVGTEWERYSARVECPQDMGTPFVEIMVPQGGTIWIDAVQFEVGTEPTPYQELRE